MQFPVEYVVGQEVFMPRVTTAGTDTQVVITKVGRKYAYGVAKKFHNTEDEKDMTFKIDLETNKRDTGYQERVYASQEQYNQSIQDYKERNVKIERFTNLKASQLTLDQIERILAIADESKA